MFASDHQTTLEVPSIHPLEEEEEEDDQRANLKLKTTLTGIIVMIVGILQIRTNIQCTNALKVRNHWVII